jgi:hypothetical protein
MLNLWLVFTSLRPCFLLKALSLLLEIGYISNRFNVVNQAAIPFAFSSPAKAKVEAVGRGISRQSIAILIVNIDKLQQSLLLFLDFKVAMKTTL